MKNNPLKTIEKLIQERYVNAKAVFWAGSVSQDLGTEASDLDLVIVFESLPHAYREALVYDEWPIDAFIHDLDTLRYFCGKLEAGDGRPALIKMILKGREVLGRNNVGKEAKCIAEEALNRGPNGWSQNQIDRERFLITDILDDLKFPKNKEEQRTSAIHLFEPLIQFYFRADNRWAASGKSLMRLLKAENPDLAREFNQSFENFFQTGETLGIENVAQKILAPYGGLLWEGFRADAPVEWKILSKNHVLQELKDREPIFHHPHKFGRTIEDIENQMCDEFWEVGASGKVYTRQDVIRTLLERYNDANHQDIWEISDFELTPIDPDHYLVRYVLVQNKVRVTRRSTIWRKVGEQWKILYHQGTAIHEGNL